MPQEFTQGQITANTNRERIMTIDSKEFYELMQAYRHAKEYCSSLTQTDVVDAYEAVIDYIDAANKAEADCAPQVAQPVQVPVTISEEQITKLAEKHLFTWEGEAVGTCFNVVQFAYELLDLAAPQPQPVQVQAEPDKKYTAACSTLAELGYLWNRTQGQWNCRIRGGNPHPVALDRSLFGYAYQRDETGQMMYVDLFQEENGFAEKNPRWHRIGPLYLHADTTSQPGMVDAQKVIAEIERKSKAWAVGNYRDGIAHALDIIRAEAAKEVAEQGQTMGEYWNVAMTKAHRDATIGQFADRVIAEIERRDDIEPYMSLRDVIDIIRAEAGKSAAIAQQEK